MNKPWLNGLSLDLQAQWAGHVVTRMQYGPVDLLTWANPRSSNYALRYAILPRDPTGATCLVVTGDLGEAVYVWHGAVTYEGIVNMNLGYFASKCQASETGRGYRKWDPDQARAVLLEHWEEWAADAVISSEASALAEALRNKKIGDDPRELYDWLTGEPGAELVFGCDAWELADCGERPHDRCALHLQGIKTAMRCLGIPSQPRKK